IHRADEVRLLAGTLEQRPRTHAEGESAVSLAMGDLAAHQAGAVLRRERLYRTARIEHGHGQRVELARGTFSECTLDNLVRRLKRQFGHRGILQKMWMETL